MSGPRTTAAATEYDPSRFYVPGGTLSAGALSYVPRRADAALYEALKDGAFAYVLTPRQQGKSSLMNRVAKLLRDEGSAVAALDLSAVGFNLDERHWYNGLLEQLGRRLRLGAEVDAYCLARPGLSPLQTWQGVLRDVVLGRVPGRVVVFLDEVDAVRSLPFSTDELFAAIRACYNARGQDPAYERLTFCLLGVAAPADLIRNPERTPFNIGRRVDLLDFTPDEAALLRFGLNKGEPTDRRILRRVYWWTGGHPYLTQRLCQAVAADNAARTPAQVDRICGRLFLTPGAELRDDNLAHVERRLLADAASTADGDLTAPEEQRAALLTRYRQVLAGRPPVPDSEADELARALKLSGAVRADAKGRLVPRNRIYARVFDRRWVHERLPGAELRRQRAAFWRGVRRASLGAAVVFGVVALLAAAAFLQWRRAEALAEGMRQNAYAGDLYQGYRELDDGFARGVRDRLEAAAPGVPGEPTGWPDDLRGFEWRHLWARLHREQADLRAHKGIAFCAAASPDGRQVATGGFDGTVCLWDAAAGRLVRRLAAPARQVTSLAFSPDGRLLAAGCGLSRVYGAVWDVPTGRLLRRAELDPRLTRARAAAAAFADDAGSRGDVVFGVDDGVPSTQGPASSRLVRWRAADGSVVVEETLPRGFVLGDGHSFASSPGGTLWAVAGLTYPPLSKAEAPAVLVQRRPATSGAVTWTRVPLPSSAAAVAPVAFSTDGRWMAVGAIGRVYVWRVGAWARPARVLVAGTGDGSVHGLSFSRGGGWLAAAAWDDIAYTWRLPDFRPGPTLLGHADRVNDVAFASGTNGRQFLVTASSDGIAKVWDPEVMGRTRDAVSFRTRAEAVALSPDGRFYGRSAPGGAVEVWRTDMIPPGRIPVAARVRGRLLAVSPEGRMAVTEAAAGRRQVRDIATGALLADLDSGSALLGGTSGRAYGMSSASFSPLGDALVLVEAGSGIRVHGRGGGREPAFSELFRADEPKVRSRAAFAPDGTCFVVAVDAPGGVTLDLWDVRGRRRVRRLRMPQDVPHEVAFSPDGRLLAAGDWAGPVAVWDLAAQGGEPGRLLFGHRDVPGPVAFSRDGRTLATTSAGRGTVKLWNVATWREVGRLETGAASPAGAAFLPGDGALVVADYRGLRVFRAPPLAEIDVKRQAERTERVTDERAVGTPAAVAGVP